MFALRIAFLALDGVIRPASLFYEFEAGVIVWEFSV
jgi:hypothetical protein